MIQKNINAIFILIIIILAGAMGYLIWRESIKEMVAPESILVPTNIPQPSQTPAAKTEISTTNIYTSSFGKFSFQLPKDYIVVSSKNCEGLCVESLIIAMKKSSVSYSNTAVSLNVTDYQKSQTFEEWNKTQPAPIKELSSIKIGGIEAKKYDTGGLFGVTQYRFVRGNFAYLITAEEMFDPKAQNEIIVSIISTFQFTK